MNGEAFSIKSRNEKEIACAMKSLRDEILTNDIASQIITGSGDRCPQREFEGRALIINHRASDIC